MKKQSFTDFINAVDANDIERAIAILNGKKIKVVLKRKSGKKKKVLKEKT